ncbi:hypothetical protein [Tunturiibacter gelidiferens]|uniref:hypothetical protein n=1 Tax=Tunturiibacter gelidiferens TaxID=3069689 RepID=UPI003D9B9F63
MNGELPEIITLTAESSSRSGYDNHPIAEINDHVVRISTMVAPYHWHFHPNSDETFLVVEGRLCIEFEGGSRELCSGTNAHDSSRGSSSDATGWCAISESYV